MAPHLPHLAGGTFVTDAGLETELVFLDGRELPAFAAYPLLADDDGVARLRRYYEAFAALAADHGHGVVLETPTWRASSRWAAELGHDAATLDALNRRAVALMQEVRAGFAGAAPVIVSGQIGPSDDGYDPAERLTADAAQAYHAPQIGSFAAAGADMVAALTMTYADEAIGIVRAARAAGLPCAISFTLETDGRLPDGSELADAIAAVDAATDAGAAYFGINCAHPTHFERLFAEPAAWHARVRSVRANASTCSHAELDAATALDAGDPQDLGERYARLRAALPGLTVVGGCCGTDRRHVAAICEALDGAAAR